MGAAPKLICVVLDFEELYRSFKQTETVAAHYELARGANSKGTVLL